MAVSDSDMRAALVAILAVLFAGLLALSGVTHALELSSIDARFALRGAQPHLARRVLIVAIDPATDRADGNAGQFPIKRRYYAEALDRLDAEGAAAVAIDVAFTTPTDTADDNALIKGLARHPGTILAATATNAEGQTQVLGGPSGQARARVRVASALFPIDSGGTYRRFPASESGLPTLAVATAEAAAPGFSPHRLGPSPAWIDFPGGPGSVRQVSLLSVIDGRVPASLVRGRAVVIGVTDPRALDYHGYSSLTDRRISGVELEADAVATALADAPLRLAPAWFAWLATLLAGVGLPVLAVLMASRGPRWGALVLIGGAVAYLLIAQLSFDAGWIAPVVVPETTLLVVGIAAVGVSLRLELARRRRDVQLARQRAITAADDARRGVERDLHDGVQQRLVSLAMRLSLPSAREDPDLLEGSVDQLRVALGELRQLARGTYPAVLETGGLAGGLQSLADHATIPVELTLGSLDDLDPEQARTAYFVASEAVANALKHAGAEHLTLSADRERGALTVRIGDDGRGGADPTGSGLRGITERAEALGGSLQVESPAGAGTRLTLRIPL